jgi:hypothetical protein
MLRIRARYLAREGWPSAAEVDESSRKLDQEVVESLKGRRVRLVFTEETDTGLQPGDEGTVDEVDGAGTLWVFWDRGRGTGPAPGGHPGQLPDRDQWEWL